MLLHLIYLQDGDQCQYIIWGFDVPIVLTGIRFWVENYYINIATNAPKNYFSLGCIQIHASNNNSTYIDLGKCYHNFQTVSAINSPDAH